MLQTVSKTVKNSSKQAFQEAESEKGERKPL